MSAKRHRRSMRLLAAGVVGAFLVGFGASAMPSAIAGQSPNEGTPPPVLAPLDVVADTAPPATSAGVAARIGALVRKAGPSFAAVVIDPSDESVLFDSRSGTPLMPASTAKLATASAALEVLGPQSRLATVVRRAGSTVYLVGGGDPSLRLSGHQKPGEPATLADLARATATALGDSSAVEVVYDDHAFRGPELGPGWPAAFPAAGVVPPITALVVDGGRVRPGASARTADPSAQAAGEFVRLLRSKGVTVSKLKAGKAPGDAAEIARVESQPVADLVQYMLTESDNAYAESLAHLVGGKSLGKPTFAGGAEATRQALDRLGIATSGFGLVDASGLSRRDRLTADTMADVLVNVARGTTAHLAFIAPGLAVAGLTGTLADRFSTPATKPGRGHVQGKTGTLTGVVSLAGIVRTRDNGPLVFALIHNGAGSIVAARDTMDTIASQLARCGCS